MFCCPLKCFGTMSVLYKAYFTKLYGKGFNLVIPVVAGSSSEQILSFIAKLPKREISTGYEPRKQFGLFPVSI